MCNVFYVCVGYVFFTFSSDLSKLKSAQLDQWNHKPQKCDKP